MNLIEKIETRSARVGVIGLGYVGLPLAMEFVNAGFLVTGIDIDENKISSLNDGENYINDVNDKDLKNAINKRLLKGSNDFSLVKDLDAISICVPTPLNKEKNPDISYIVSVMDKIKDFIHENMLIVLESTTYPGSTRELILPYIENNNLILGKNIYLCFSPERIDPGNKTYNTSNTPKIIGGLTPECSDTGKKLYSTIINELIIVSSPETAEMVKLLENTFRAINIGLANEVAIMCEKLGINAWEVIDAAATKPFGFMKFTPGPGLGGHCIPIDPYYLSWKLKTLDYDARFIKLAGEINTYMPKHVINLIRSGLNKYEKAINGSQILIVGVAYKKDIDDCRESPALDIISLLDREGANVQYHDPYVENLNFNDIDLKSIIKFDKDSIKNFDACVILTNHSNINYKIIAENSNLIIDTRNVFHDINRDNIIKLGQG
ncbi:nucleotide sugar dehydrogenase [Candidatus Marinimicrobia bacterium]|nr:nucleotide sugar dehydrogenase [Candidatus Neomarinimicrobiota bacterium]